MTREICSPLRILFRKQRTTTDVLQGGDAQVRGFTKGLLLGGLLGAAFALVMAPDGMMGRREPSTVERMGEHMQKLGAKMKD